jgi:hypothetical protein
MSDFSELCPLFNTGVFNEITFENISMTNITGCGNALLGSLTCGSATRTAVWTFGRTVIVVGGFLRQLEEQGVASTCELRLMHHTSLLAAGTGFATYAASNTTDGWELLHGWVPFDSATDKTFTSTDILGFAPLTGTAADGGVIDLILRYKEA